MPIWKRAWLKKLDFCPFGPHFRLRTFDLIVHKTNSKKETTLLQTFSVHFSEVKLCRLCLFVVYLCPNCGRSGLVVIMSYFLAKEKVFEKLWIAWWKRFSIVVAIDKNLRFLVTWISRYFSRLFSTSLGMFTHMIIDQVIADPTQHDHTGPKIHILSKNHFFKISIFTKFTFSKSHIS